MPGFIIQGYDLQGDIPDLYLDTQQRALTKILEPFLGCVPCRGATQDVIPALFGRNLEPTDVHTFFEYVHGIMTNPMHPQLRQLKQQVFVGKPCVYEPTADPTTGLFSIKMQRSMIQGMNDIRNEMNPRMMVFCNLETLKFFVLHFPVDRDIIQMAARYKLPQGTPCMEFVWGHDLYDNVTHLKSETSTANCCRYGCRQIIHGQAAVHCSKCHLHQYCSKKCRKKDLKRHAKNCLTFDMQGNVTCQGLGTNSEESIATEAPKSCATCGRQEASGRRLKKCQLCESIYFCNKICQEKGWKSHRGEECENLQRAKEAKEAKEEEEMRSAKDDAAKVSVSQGGEQQTCHLEGCERTRMKGGGCPCKTVGYCCIEHQKKHWSKHKSDHKRIMKEIKRKK